jgi:hypothetical protein
LRPRQGGEGTRPLALICMLKNVAHPLRSAWRRSCSLISPHSTMHSCEFESRFPCSEDLHESPRSVDGLQNARPS